MSFNWQSKFILSSFQGYVPKVFIQIYVPEIHGVSQKNTVGVFDTEGTVFV